jgi:hypothetical protein
MSDCTGYQVIVQVTCKLVLEDETCEFVALRRSYVLAIEGLAWI